MSPPSLLGPPELRHSTASSSAMSTSSGDPFMDLMVASFNKTAINHRAQPPVGFTENGSATFLSSGNPCLDLFFHVVPGTAADTLERRLGLAWAHNPLTTLKLICNLRGVRGTGKSDKEGYYVAALWLHRHHPKTLACNVASLASFGYFKDLPEILFRLLHGADVRKIAKQKVGSKSLRRRGRTAPFQKRKNFRAVPKAKLLEFGVKQEKEKAAVGETRHQRRIQMAKNAVERSNHDPDYRFLNERISDLFADCLKSDIDALNSGELGKISLAAKWCPSIDSSFDRSTLLCESIARKVFPIEKYSEYEGIEDAHYAYRVRDRLRKQVLVPLRKALELPEVYMTANQWNLLPYNRVALVAMKNYKNLFLKHDKERFNKYLEDVNTGNAKIAAGALLPHEIIAALDDEDGGKVAELQWRRMVDDLSKKGNFKSSIAVCDVSGSMMGIPMEVCVALGILVSELSETPWKGKVITFSADPQLHLIEGENLQKKTEFVRQMQWGMNTNFQKVFNLILNVALAGKLKKDQMIKRVFVFSDMEFDQASPRRWETDYERIVSRFKEEGYGKSVPEIVFWNLRDSRATPVPATEKGVALVSGFSKNLLKLFLDNDGVADPVEVMEAAISGEEYQKLVILD